MGDFSYSVIMIMINTLMAVWEIQKKYNMLKGEKGIAVLKNTALPIT